MSGGDGRCASESYPYCESKTGPPRLPPSSPRPHPATRAHSPAQNRHAGTHCTLHITHVGVGRERREKQKPFCRILSLRCSKCTPRKKLPPKENYGWDLEQHIKENGVYVSFVSFLSLARLPTAHQNIWRCSAGANNFPLWIYNGPKVSSDTTYFIYKN